MSRLNDRYLKRVLVAGGAEAANSYTEIYEKVKHRRPRSTLINQSLDLTTINNNQSAAHKNVRFSNGVAVGPEVVHFEPQRPHGSPSRWTTVRNALDFTKKVRRTGKHPTRCFTRYATFVAFVYRSRPGEPGAAWCSKVEHQERLDLFTRPTRFRRGREREGAIGFVECLVTNVVLPLAGLDLHGRGHASQCASWNTAGGSVPQH